MRSNSSQLVRLMMHWVVSLLSSGSKMEPVHMRSVRPMPIALRRLCCCR